MRTRSGDSRKTSQSWVVRKARKRGRADVKGVRRVAENASDDIVSHLEASMFSLLSMWSEMLQTELMLVCSLPAICL